MKADFLGTPFFNNTVLQIVDPTRDMKYLGDLYRNKTNTVMKKYFKKEGRSVYKIEVN